MPSDNPDVPPLPSSEPSQVSVPPPILPTSDPLRNGVAIVLSLGLGIFLADAVVSLADDSFILLFGLHVLTLLRGITCSLALAVAVVIYLLMGLTPLIPKRVFLPLSLFALVGLLATVPAAIYCYDRMQQISWVISLSQVLLGLFILHRMQGGFRLRWPLVAAHRLAGRGFSWRNLSGFLLANIFGLLPAILIYFVLGAVLALDHFSDGFVALRPAGLTVQVRKYIRPDGKTIQLVPMSHVGETPFYQSLARSFPTNALVLMEGVTDEQNLITNQVAYERMAAALGVAEQQEAFEPRGELVLADVDVSDFTPGTIAGLNLIMLVHAQGLNAGTLMKLLQFSQPHLEEQFFEDLLRKRNRHLLNEIEALLPAAEHIIVPWGAAHMPELAREIQKAGFQVVETRDYVAIEFRSKARKNKPAANTNP